MLSDVVPARPLATMLWQIGVTPKHWRYEVWIDGTRCVDAVAVRVDRRAIVMRFRDGTYDRDGLDRIKADLVGGRVEVRRVQADRRLRHRKSRGTINPYKVVICQTDEELTIGRADSSS